MTELATPPASETDLIARAQTAVSHCNWEVGECAAVWTKRFAKGRTDADFAILVGLSPDQVYQRRRTWETFGDVVQNYPQLKWSHFYAALNWDDAAECLQWAQDIGASVAETKAWRRAQRGEDLSTIADDEAPFSMMPTDPVPVKLPGDGLSSGRSGANDGRGAESQSLVASAARSTGEGPDSANETYAPFREGAAHVPASGDRPSATQTLLTTEQMAKKLTTTLERCHAVITDDFLAEFPTLKEKVQKRFLKAFEQLQEKLDGLL